MQDLVFLGGGLSSTLTLTYLLRHLSRQHRNLFSQRLKITVVDAKGDFGPGHPYGSLAHPMFLLNENVATMNVCGFLDWLTIHRATWLEELEACNHPAVENWLLINRDALASAAHDPRNYLPLYLPRRVFGLFLRDLLKTSLVEAEKIGLAQVDLVTAEALSVARDSEGNLRIPLSNGNMVRSRQIVLALGSSSPAPDPRLEGRRDYIHNLFREGIGPILVSKFAGVFSNAAEPRTIVLVGSNASAMETVYAIRNTPDLLDPVAKVVVISGSGLLPDAAIFGPVLFEAEHLKALIGRSALPDDLFQAARRDALAATALGLSSLQYSAPVCDAFRAIFCYLSAEEKRKFVERYGLRFTALNRHAPPEYSAATRHLKSMGKLRIVSARVTDIEPATNRGSGFSIKAMAPNDFPFQLFSSAVINCSGAGALALTSNGLLRSILREGSEIAQMNRSQMGIRVGENFEASNGVFVIGPLLAGHTGDKDSIWNLESAPRIDALAQRFSLMLADRICGNGAVIGVPRSSQISESRTQRTMAS